jgi:hypothetical protein
MTIWYGGSGWGWCNVFAHFPSMAILWAIILTGVAVTVGFAIGQRNDPAVPAPTRFVRAKGAVATRISRDESGDAEFWRRLM